MNDRIEGLIKTFKEHNIIYFRKVNFPFTTEKYVIYYYALENSSHHIYINRFYINEFHEQ